MNAQDGDYFAIDLGPCCACFAAGQHVRNVMLLSFRAPVQGTGWGCFLCGLPADGAIAVLCDSCLRSGAQPTTVCQGRPAHGERALYPHPMIPFEHNPALHTEELPR